MNVEIDTLDFNIDYFVNRKCTTEWNLPESVIDYHNLMFLYEGKCDFYMDGKLYQLEKGDVIYAHEGIIRKANTFEDNLMQCYAFSFHLKNVPYGLAILPPYIKAGMDNELLLTFSRLCQTWLENDIGTLLKCRALFMLIVCKLLVMSKNIDRSVKDEVRINRVKQFIYEHLTEEISVAQLAKIVGLNPVYFGSLFQKHAGYSAKEYINRLRIQKSCDLLRTGDCSVKEAAYQCGFDDIYYFSKTFKKINGIPPSSYSRQASRENMNI